MKKIKLALLLLIVSIAYVHAQNKSDSDQIIAIMKAQEKSWNEGDLEKFMIGYWQDDSLAFIGSNGITYGWKPCLERYKKSYPNKKTMGLLSFEILKVEVLNEQHAYVVGKWKLEREEKPVSGYYTLLWKKIDSKWVIVTDHSS
ncbi:MAG: nuclear transport factor 2 family protein [Bacteroidetes bacterium]|nr:nuclear transport factor 2 family protein [Bacteroidota bacterium]